MADPMSPAVQITQLRLRSITAGLSDYSTLEAKPVEVDGLPALQIFRGSAADARCVVVPVAHIILLARLENDHPARAPVAPTPLHVPAFGGKTFDPEKDEVRLSRGLKAVQEVMKDGAWRTLFQLRQAVLARHKVETTEAAISARLRDLRKPQYGGHTVERARVENNPALWRYRLAQKAEA